HQVSTAASAATIARDVEHTERSTTLPPDTASRVARAVTLQQVSFRYPDGRAGLHDLNIEFAAGETTAVIGPSGAGKSTLLQLVL
ncbi:ATP-binding cassette domain-containing protein, partial [Bacillus sp. SIMBA_031]